MKLFGGILVLLMGIAVSLVAAWFSVTGMVALFNASAMGVLAMMVSLEAAKLVASGWLKFYWKAQCQFPPSHLHAVCGRHPICDHQLGIYGYLSAGHLEQTAPRAELAVQAQPLGTSDSAEERREHAAPAAPDADRPEHRRVPEERPSLQGPARVQRSRRKAMTIQKKLDENNTAINDLNAKLAPLKMKNNEVEAKLGPIKYLAALVNSNPKTVRITR
jgi:hypothetical protein